MKTRAWWLAAMAAVAAAANVVKETDVAYGEDGAQRLDLYRPEGATDAPIMVYVHGGGWERGDKGAVWEKPDFFTGRGWLLASVNYRLGPAGRHPHNVNDVARAVAWMHDHAAAYGGDAGKIFLMGHSAGAHLVALAATSEAPLREAGKSRAILRGVICLDTNMYDVADRMTSRAASFYRTAFGDDPKVWHDASPSAHVATGQGIPPFLICYSRGLGQRPNPDRPEQANAFAAKLREAGVPAEVVDASDRNHGDINRWFGRADDQTVTGAAIRFLDDILNRQRTGGADVPLVRFTRDYVAGTRDANGQFMGGTETMRIVAHAGELFAGLSYWTDEPGNDPVPGAQILVKRGADSAWQLSQSFPGALRVNAMETVRFTTDWTGRVLQEPVELLMADAGLIRSRGRGPLRCVVYDGPTDRWGESTICDEAPRAFIRAFGAHRDGITAVHCVFAGTGAGEVYRGSHDPDSPGGIRWEPRPEYVNPDFDGGAFNRCQGFCVANGKLYAAIAPRLLERRDGPDPVWTEVFRWQPRERPGAGLRGITAVPALDGDHQVILGSREQEARILRIDPARNFQVTDELNSQDFLKERLGGFLGGKLVAYNRCVPGVHPTTGEPIHWLTVVGVKTGDMAAAWLLIRHADATYEPVRVADPDDPDPPLLVSTRTLEFAPWSDREFYTGGYDGAANKRRNHNTAWIFKGILTAGEEHP